ncbi:hypothetical protein HRH25_20905 [Flavisolibacter sp. BT320]|nr:hypothetical protein [Flavisolibacter longurius]
MFKQLKLWLRIEQNISGCVVVVGIGLFNFVVAAIIRHAGFFTTAFRQMRKVDKGCIFRTASAKVPANSNSICCEAVYQQKEYGY